MSENTKVEERLVLEIHPGKYVADCRCCATAEVRDACDFSKFDTKDRREREMTYAKNRFGTRTTRPMLLTLKTDWTLRPL